MLTPLKSPLTLEIRGKLGPYVYARNHWGPLARIRPGARTMSSPFQDTQRARMKTVSLRWSNNLSQPQRDAWLAFAQTLPPKHRLGQPYSPGGFCRFIACNLIAYKINGSFLDWPPANLDINQPTAILITAATHSPQLLTATLSHPSSPTDCAILNATLPRNPGRHNPGMIWRPLTILTPPWPDSQDLTAAYNANFGTLTAGKRIWLTLQLANPANGAVSTQLLATALIS
jgi:hypothetical protein